MSSPAGRGTRTSCPSSGRPRSSSRTWTQSYRKLRPLFDRREVEVTHAENHETERQVAQARAVDRRRDLHRGHLRHLGRRRVFRRRRPGQHPGQLRRAEDLVGRVFPDPPLPARVHREAVRRPQRQPHPAARHPPADPRAARQPEAPPGHRRGHGPQGVQRGGPGQDQGLSGLPAERSVRRVRGVQAGPRIQPHPPGGFRARPAAGRRLGQGRPRPHGRALRHRRRSLE